MSAGPTTRRIGSVLRSSSRRYFELIAENRRGERRVDEPRRDQVYADGGELERQVLRHRRQRGGERRDEREAARRAPAAGAAHEEQGSARANSADGVARDLKRQQEMRLDVAACLLHVELGKRRVIRARTGDQHVVDRRTQLAEESSELLEIRGVEGRGIGCELAADALQPVGIPRGQDQRRRLRRARAARSRAQCPSCRQSRRRICPASVLTRPP